MRINFTLSLIVLFFVIAIPDCYSSLNNNAFPEVGYWYAVLLFSILFIAIIKMLHGLKANRFVSAFTVLMAISISSYAQCINVNSASWNKNSSVAGRIVYNDGTQTRLANSTSDNTRAPDGTVVNWTTAVNTTPTILPAASNTGTVTVPVGQKQTLSTIYATPNTIPLVPTQFWQMGWAYNPAFTGAASTATSFTANTITQWNTLWSVVLTDRYVSSTVTNLTITGSDGVSLTFYSGVVLPGDSIAVSIIPQSNGTVVAQGLIYRPSIHTLLGEGSILLGMYINEALNPIYAAVSVNEGIVNMGCIKQLTTTAETSPFSGNCISSISSPWALNDGADPTYTLVFDGSQTRLAPKSNTNNRVASSSAGGATIADVAMVHQNPVRLWLGDTSVISTTFLPTSNPGGALGSQKWIQGWVYSPTFTGAAASAESPTVNTANWATNLSIQGNTLSYYNDAATSTTVYSSLVAGDQIIGRLVPALNGLGADLQVTVYRSSIGATVAAAYYTNALTTGTEAATTMYPAIEIQNGEVNLSCISAALNTLPSVGGTPFAEQSICSGTSPATLRLTGFLGSVVKWQYSSDSFVNNVNDIASSANYLLTSAQMGTLTANTYYRAVVQNSTNASANSSPVLIKVNTAGGCTALNPGVVGALGRYDDFDGDGIRNNLDIDADNDVDIDDDNDGILDAIEAPTCYYSKTEAAVVTGVTSALTVATIANTYDNNYTTSSAMTGAQALTGSTVVFQINFTAPITLSSLTDTLTSTTSIFTNGSTYKLQGSLDSTNWADVSSVQTAATLPAARLVIPVTGTTPYQFYRILGLSGTTAGGTTIEFIPTTASYTASSNPKNTCTADADNDGITNDKDLDSDGDGCTDAKEAGVYNKAGVTMQVGAIQNGSGGMVTTTTPGIGNATVVGPYSGNGFADVLQATDTNAYKFIYTTNNAFDFNNRTACAIVPTGTLSGSSICNGALQGTLTFTATVGTGPFTLIINGVTYTNILSGVPFNVSPVPTVTTVYSLTSIKDANANTNP